MIHKDYLKAERFESISKDLADRIGNKLEEFEGMKNEISDLNEKIAVEISSSVRKITKQENSKILQQVNATLRNQTQGYWDNTELKKLIDLKADKFSIIELNDLKSNKIDTENNMKAIDIIHKQIRHLVIMLMENFRVQVETETSSRNARINKMNVVLQQSLLLAKWIVKFNPENLNSYDLTLPDDLKDFQDFVTQSMDGIAFANVQSYQNKQALSK